MAIQPYQGGKGGMGKLMGAVGGAQTGATFGPYGAVIGGVLGMAQNKDTANVAKLGMDAMGRKKSAMEEDMAKDPMNPEHEATVKQGLEQLPNAGLPPEQEEYLAKVMIAGLTHGRYGQSYDHLLTNEPGQSYVDEAGD